MTGHVPHRAALAFNDAIDRRDLDALGDLMADDHRFIDSDDNVLAGRAAVLEAWAGFFDAFPDYRNEWSKVIASGGALIALGRSVCPRRFRTCPITSSPSRRSMALPGGGPSCAS
jgi:ketosteroid isomerase-like protein